MTTTSECPGKYDVAINGVGYMLMEEGDQPALIRQSIRQQREQAGGANANIGELSVNPEGFWRRSRDGWHLGAGQTYADRDESEPLRFRTSRRVDVFGTRHQLSLVNAMSEAFSRSGTNDDQPVNVGGKVYFLDAANTVVKVTSTPTTLPWTPTTITGTPGSANSLAAIGGTLFIGTSAGVYSLDTTTTVAAIYTTTAVPLLVWAAKGRLMVAGAGGTFYNVTAGGALPTALITFPAGSGAVGVVGQSNWIYIAVAGANCPSLIYKTTIQPDGTALGVPTVAGEFPDGEVLASATRNPIFGYLGKLFAHTNRGIRMASIDDNGNLTFGSVIPSSFQNEAAWAAQDRFVWYSDCDEFAVNRIGKLDLSQSILPNTPAYASDMEPDTVHVVGGMTYAGGKVIAFTSTKVYVQADTYVDDGYVDSGLLALDLADLKTPVSFDVEAAYPDDSTITEALSVDRGASFTDIQTWDAGDTAEAAVTGIAASRQFELRTTLTASTDNTESPVLYRHTLKAEPNINQGDYLILRLRLFEDVVDNTGARVGRTPNTDLAALRSLQQARTVIEVQEGSTTYTATLRDMDVEAQTRCAPSDDGSWNSVATVRLKIVTAA